MAVVRSPLGRARGMGSSKHGVGHFVAQRVTAVALIFLVLWALASALTLANGDYEGAAAWLRSPINAALACLLACCQWSTACPRRYPNTFSRRRSFARFLSPARSQWASI